MANAEIPPAAAPVPPIDIGQIADPPFAVLPDPARLFLTRAARMAALADGNPAGPYLLFLSAIATAQHDAQRPLPAPVMPPEEVLERAYSHTMPPIAGAELTGEAFAVVLMALLDQLEAGDVTPECRQVATALRSLAAEDWSDMAEAVLQGAIPADEVAAHVLVAAALQVHAARLAAGLEASRLTRIADAICPACGSPPVASQVVGWPGAHGARFCQCSVCATNWHVPRIRCLSCGNEKDVAYHGIEGGPEAVRAETCDACRSYVKIFHQHKDPKIEPLADDVASLGLDVMLREEGYTRVAANPFLLGE